MHNKYLKTLSISLATIIIAVGFNIAIPSKAFASTNTVKPKLTYGAHVQDYGWDRIYKNASYNEMALNMRVPSSKDIIGTTGQSKRMEALEINFEAPAGVTIKYRAHVQDYGWMGWVTADKNNYRYLTNFVGTTGQSKRVEAFQIVVEGLEDYDIKYRVHAQDYGWMNWVTACKSMNSTALVKGNYAGTVGQSKRMEAFQIVIVESESAKAKAKAQAEEEARARAEAQAKAQLQSQAEAKAKALAEAEAKAKAEAEAKAKAAHTHNYSNWVTVVEPTCYTNGKETRTCTICGETETRLIGAKHNLVRTPEKDVEATCTQDGKKMYECVDCKDHVEFNIVKKLGHDWDSKTTRIEPTCTQDGVEYIACSRCSEKKNPVVIKATGHNWGEYQIDNEATCTENGTKTRKCATCGQTETVVYQKALGHAYAKTYTVDQEATCENVGYKSIHCTREGCTHKHMITPIAKSGHKYKLTSVIVEPTCAEDGKGIATCEVCKATKTVSIKYSEDRHEWKDTVEREFSKCGGTIIYRQCKKCGQLDPKATVSAGTGHKWDSEDYVTAHCSVCGVKAPCWTNKWAAENYTYENGKIIWLKEGEPHRIRACWWVYFVADTQKCYGFDGQGLLIPNAMIDADYVFTQEAPNPKPGYKFVGWYNKGTDEQITTKTKVEANWKYFESTLEARYEPIEQK